MRKKLIFITLGLVLFGVFSSKTIAQTATNSASGLKERMQLLQADKKAAISAKREEFKLRLQAIKDQRKKLLMERIDAKIAEVNKNQTDRYTEALNKLQSFLDKFNKSATEAGKLSDVLADITAAQTAIDTARTAVDAQAANTYAITITDDLTLKVNAGKIMSQFRLDLVAVHKLVVDAKQAVQKLNTDRKLIKKEKEATESAE